MKILIVDDSKIMCKIISGALNKAGIDEILIAYDGREALEILKQNDDIELLFLDWNMPVMTGIELLKVLRASEISIPVIMVTTEAEQEKVLEALNEGACDYLVKPFGLKEIKAKLDKFSKPVQLPKDQ